MFIGDGFVQTNSIFDNCLTPELLAKSRSSGGFRSSSPSRSRSSKPSSSSKPSYSAPPSKKATPTKNAKPSSPSKPSYSAPPSKKPVPRKNVAADAQKRVTSKKTFEKSNIPKSTYVSKSGKEIKISSKATNTQRVRSLSPTEYKNRSVRSETHYVDTFGSNRYGYYRSQPSIYIGGGYSSPFWYSTFDLPLTIQALWLWNNQRTIQSELYQQRMQNAALAAEVAKLQNGNVPINENYVPPQFEKNPDLMYSQEFVDAAYNPKPESRAKTFLCWGVSIFIVCILVIVLIRLVFTVNVTK